jgi:hydrogenase nickel incorporation protein HypA/HybF
MHEMSIAQSLVDILHEEMSKAGAHTLRSVRLEIGRMSAIVPDALSFGFEVVTAGTDLEGAELIMDMVPLRGSCRDCGREFDIENYAFLCPHCGGHEIDTLSGRELSVVEIMVD